MEARKSRPSSPHPISRLRLRLKRSTSPVQKKTLALRSARAKAQRFLAFLGETLQHVSARRAHVHTRTHIASACRFGVNNVRSVRHDTAKVNNGRRSVNLIVFIDR